MKITTLTIFLAVILTSSLPLSSLAVEQNYTIPGPHPPSEGPAGQVANLYSFALLISGALAFGAIVYGGIKYTLAAGNPSGQSEGKEWVKSALLGLLLLGGAYLILRTINPALVSLRLAGLPELPPVTPSATSSGPPQSSPQPYKFCMTRLGTCIQFPSQEACESNTGLDGTCFPGTCPC